jgi:tetratricopeptide (TPR) repeat protein
MIEDGRAALERCDFEAAFDLLAAADTQERLEPEDLERVGEAGWWIGRHEESMAFRQRAYHAYAQAGESVPAGVVAIALTIQYANRMEYAVAGGWFAKAERQLEGEDESAATGWRDLVSCLFAEARSDWESVLATSRTVSAVGRRHGVADLEALGLAFEGLALTHRGDPVAGTRLLDEAMASALGGGLGAVATGVVYCRMLCACLDLHDFGRAAEWTEAITRHVETPGLAGLPGDCRTHRAEVLLRRGAWGEGAEEARRAVEETSTLELPHVGIAASELGEIRLRQGDLEGAEEAFQHAREYGSTAEPGFALLRLARNQYDEAVAGLDAALAAAGTTPLVRARLLPARIELALATDDLDVAQAMTRELAETASSYGVPALLAAAEHAHGALDLAEG